MLTDKRFNVHNSKMTNSRLFRKSDRAGMDNIKSIDINMLFIKKMHRKLTDPFEKFKTECEVQSVHIADELFGGI